MDSSDFRSFATGVEQHFQATVPDFHARIMDPARDPTFSDDSRGSPLSRSTSSWRGKRNEAMGVVHGLVDRCRPRRTRSPFLNIQPCSAPVQDAGGRLRRQKDRIKDYMSSFLRPDEALLQRQTSRPETQCLEVLHSPLGGRPISTLIPLSGSQSEGNSPFASSDFSYYTTLSPPVPRFWSQSERNGSLASSGLSNFTDLSPPSLSRTIDTWDTASSFPDVGDHTLSQSISQQQSDAIDFPLSLVHDSATERFTLPSPVKDIQNPGKAHAADTNRGTTARDVSPPSDLCSKIELTVTSRRFWWNPNPGSPSRSVPRLRGRVQTQGCSLISPVPPKTFHTLRHHQHQQRAPKNMAYQLLKLVAPPRLRKRLQHQ